MRKNSPPIGTTTHKKALSGYSLGLLQVVAGPRLSAQHLRAGRSPNNQRFASAVARDCKAIGTTTHKKALSGYSLGLLQVVAGPRIELGTQGFSVLCSTD
jgi:malonyl CoA-acyl carrier protein transacylase